ncbi:hypothetical protein V1264_023350 [Littorina saxatilis]|uniref:MARVEL domain-containing protein n=1 Tax=Littorina saxatilis TaxID=31220 RepID=A0AAN9B719_9CAEN
MYLYAMLFALPHICITCVQVLALLAVATVAGWSSKGVTYRDLHRSDFSVLGNINFFIAIAVISIIYLAINVAVILLNKPLVPPRLDLSVCGVLSTLLLLSSVILAVSLTKLGGSTAVQEAGLLFHSMESGLAFGFMVSACMVCSTWFAFRAKMVEGEIPPEQSRSIAELPGDIPT